jgi:DNA-binding HxlR family transcriptional regulator
VVTARRTYGQRCGIARALDLVGERWALLVVRDLLLGPKRFTDLRESLPGIATNVLTQRLKQLEVDGVVRRRKLPPPAASTVYELTEYGRDLEPVLLAFGRWGAKSFGPPTGDERMRSDWFGVALKAYFTPEAAEGVDATVALRFDDGSLSLAIRDGRLDVSVGAPDAADLTLTAETPATVAAFLSGAIDAAALAPEGDEALLARLPAIFPFVAHE